MTTETEQKTLADFIGEHSITMTVESADSNPHMENSDNMDHWRCKLVNRSRKTRMTLIFSKGMGHHGAEPRIEEVLDCLASDGSGVENSRGNFSEWCDEYGYDADSRRAERTFNATVKQTDKLRNLLGEEAFEELLWNVERQ